MRKYFLEDPLHPKGGITIECKDDHDCVFCERCSDVWWDYTNLIYMIACIIAQKWMLDLEHKDCSFSYDGLKWFYEDEMGDDMRQFKVLIDGHEKRIEEYRDKKREERLAEREKNEV